MSEREAEAEAAAMSARAVIVATVCITAVVMLFSGSPNLKGAIVAWITPPPRCEIVLPGADIEEAQ